MFLVSDIKQTRVYQEAKQEGRQEGREEGRQNGEMILLIRQLSKRFGKLKDIYIENINSLNIEQLEKLGEALLDFTDINGRPPGETHLNFIDKIPFLCINERIGIYRLMDFFRVIVMV
jgi:hypothetical protein